MRSGLRGAVLAGSVLLGACGAQAPDEVQVTYRAAFDVAEGATGFVDYPFPEGTLREVVQQGLSVTDGGTAEVLEDADGLRLRLQGRGGAEARFSVPAVKGGGEGDGLPEIALSQGVPDAGVAVRRFRVNVGGASRAQVEFEYTASRDCGPGCGGVRSWKHSGPVSIGGPQSIETQYSEQER